MQAACLTIANPFDPLGSRELRRVRRRLKVSRLAPRIAAPVVAMLNGRPLLRRAWRRRLRDGDTLVFWVLPQDRDRGSNPLRTLLNIAMLAVAPWVAGLALGASASTVLFGSFTLGQAATLAVGLLGTAAINALLPMPTPRQPEQLPTPSAVYSLRAQGNLARLEQAIPVQYEIGSAHV